MPETKKLSLRVFLESLEKKCRAMSSEALTNFLVHYAKTLAPEKRHKFLANFYAFDGNQKFPPIRTQYWTGLAC